MDLRECGDFDTSKGELQEVILGWLVEDGLSLAIWLLLFHSDRCSLIPLEIVKLWGSVFRQETQEKQEDYEMSNSLVRVGEDWRREP